MKERWKSTGLALALFLGNLWLVRGLLTVEYLRHMGSIEGARIALSRWMLENWRDLSWFPLWYGGIPFENAYLPLWHAMVAALAAVTGFTPAHAYHVAIAVAYALGPVTLFLLVLRMTGSNAYSTATALFYSLLSPSAFLVPVLAQDMGSVWRPRRLQDLVLYGEGPHVAALTLLPLVLILLIVAFERRRPIWWLLAALGISSVLLTNWLGTAELILMAAAWLLAYPEKPWWKPWLGAAGLVAGAYAIASPWIPPGAVWAFVHSEEFRAGGYTSQPANTLLALAAAITGLLLLLRLFRRWRAPASLRFAILFLYPTFLITMSSIASDPGLMPHRLRFHLVMEMGIALLLGVGAGLATERLPSQWKRYAACVLLAWCSFPAARYAAHAGRLIQPVDIGGTVEYQEAKWLQERVAGGRVFVPGSIRFFLNAFTDVPQFAGGFDPGVVNPLWTHVNYQILSGENAGLREGEIAILWLKAFGVDAVAVSGPKSREAYRDYRNPLKFDGLLSEAWRDGDDVIYRVPRRSAGLAHVVRRGDLPARRPVNGIDVEPVRPYVSALEDASRPLATLTWRSRHEAVISARIEKAEILSVQISYHPGWKASVDGRPRRVYGDNLGQLVVEPECDGACTVALEYNGSIESALARLASIGTLLGFAAWVGIGAFRKRLCTPAEKTRIAGRG
jgi:hypothetical protein